MTINTSKGEAALTDLQKPDRDWRAFLRGVIPFLGLIFVFVMFTVTTDGNFASLSNLRIIATQSIITIVGGLGTTFVMSHGNLDFSLGGVLAMTALAGWQTSQVSLALVLPACIAIGMLWSGIVGALHIFFRVPAFVVSLCVMFVGRGYVGGASRNVTMLSPISYANYDNLPFFLIVVLIVFGITFFLFEYTKIGKYNKAIGSNIKATELSGVPVNKYKLIAFLISGATLGVCGFLTLIRSGGVAGAVGAMFEMEVLMALVLGGLSISGGSTSKLRCIIIGALLYLMLGNGLIHWGTDPNLINVVRGAVFLGAVFLTFDRESQMVVA